VSHRHPATRQYLETGSQEHKFWTHMLVICTAIYLSLNAAPPHPPAPESLPPLPYLGDSSQKQMPGLQAIRPLTALWLDGGGVNLERRGATEWPSSNLSFYSPEHPQGPGPTRKPSLAPSSELLKGTGLSSKAGVSSFP
jgi:hypothetical protein